MNGCTAEAPAPVWFTHGEKKPRFRCPIALAGRDGLDMARMLLDEEQGRVPVMTEGAMDRPRALVEAGWYVHGEANRG